jgi:hypothetical protein
MTINFTSKVAIIAAGAAFSIAVLPSAAQAAILTQWNFNSRPANTNAVTGDKTPSTGSGTVSRVGGTTGSLTTDEFVTAEDGGSSTDPATVDDSALNTTTYPGAAADDRTAGVQFNVSTVGQQNVRVSFDQYFSATSSKYAQFQYFDGTTFVNFGDLVVGTFNAWSNNKMFDLSGIAAANNNANFAFRIVSAFAPNSAGYIGTGTSPQATTGGTYATDGQWRFDMATVNAEAIPTPAMLPGLVGLGMGLWRQRKQQSA